MFVCINVGASYMINVYSERIREFINHVIASCEGKHKLSTERLRHMVEQRSSILLPLFDLVVIAHKKRGLRQYGITIYDETLTLEQIVQLYEEGLKGA